MKTQAPDAQTKQKKPSNKKGIGVSMLLGACIGISILPWVFALDSFAAYWLAMLLFIAVNILIIPIHEAGHLICGLLTGYRLQSFAAFRWQLSRTENNKWKISTWHLPGAMGQCVMVPPEWPQDGRLPYGWYNAGGVLITAVLALGALLAALPRYGTMAGTMWWAVFLGLLLSVLNNLLPLSQLINNDGKNLFLLRQRKQARYAMWKQLRINAENLQGKRLQDLPEEWFVNEEPAQNTLEGEIEFIHLYRLLEMREYERTKQECHAMLDNHLPLMLLRKKMIVAIGALCELLTDEKGECLREYVTPEYQKSVQGMQGMLLMPVVAYGVHLLHDHDLQKAERSRLMAEKIIVQTKMQQVLNLPDMLLMQSAFEKWQAGQAQDEENMMEKETNG